MNNLERSYLVARIGELEIENEKFRTALKEYADRERWFELFNFWAWRDDHEPWTIAQEALGNSQ